MRVLFFVFTILFSTTILGQQHNIDSLNRIGVCTPQGFTIPSILGMPRSKGVEVYQERTPSYNINTVYKGADTTSEEFIRRTKSWMAKLNVPILNKDHFKFITGIKYHQQEYAFENPEDLAGEFYNGLQDKPIRSMRISLYAIKSFIGNKYLAARGTFRLNGDFNHGSISTHQKTSLSFIYGIKHHKYRTWGMGISYSNTFGRSSIYPIFLYRHKFKPQWAIEALLPVSVRLMFQPNNKNIFYFDNKLEGDNYNLNFQETNGSSVYLEKADFKSFLTYEREVYDFLWLGISGGLRVNINFNISETDAYFDRTFPIGNKDDLVIENTLSDAMFFRFGIFMVPPKNWLKDK